MKNEKQNILVFFGGCSSEYSVSLSSASGVLLHLDREKYNPLALGITEQGEWYYYTGSVEKILDNTWKNKQDCIPAVLSPNRGEKCLLLLKENGVERVPVDVAFPVLHGRNGEDGTLQGMIELAGIPLAGCGTLASALCMDKDRAHKLAGLAGVRVPKALVLEAEFSPSDSNAIPADRESASGLQCLPDSVSEAALPPARAADLPGTSDALTPAQLSAARSFAQNVGYPLYVKPVKAGSSYGVTKVNIPEELAPALALAFRYDNQVILEENIEGFEVGCAVLGSRELITGEVDEIELSGGFFDFTEKYTLKTSAIHVPARIPSDKSAEIKEAAKRIYRALGCSGFARVDMFLTPEGEIVFNEVNTIPGFTEHSRYPGMMKAAGYSLRKVLTKIIEQAVRL